MSVMGKFDHYGSFVNSKLSSLDTAELRLLLDDEVKFKNLFHDIFGENWMKKEIEEQVKNNHRMATTNLKFKPILEKNREEIRTIAKDSTALILSVEGKLAKLRKTTDISECFECVLEESEKQAGAISERFLGGQIGVSDFVEEFIPLKSKYYIREVKKDKLHMFLERRSRCKSTFI